MTAPLITLIINYYAPTKFGVQAVLSDSRDSAFFISCLDLGKLLGNCLDDLFFLHYSALVDRSE
jgi:hypothetical protein